MLRKYLRLIIAGILVVGSVLLIVKASVSAGIWVLLLAGLFVLFHFKNEMNLVAFFFVRKNNLEKAGKVLEKVKHPEGMIKSQEAYYYFLRGLVELNTGKPAKSEKSMKRALEAGLRMKNDQAMAKLNLSGIYLSRRNKKLSKYYLQEAKKLDKQKLLSEQIKEIETMLKRI
ncbi:DUF2892 domain-containing protein [Puteibacter caeruleilacunae]|nr:DUF2892 domain-containing protein [Puteibacter caeruleilacunae]